MQQLPSYDVLAKSNYILRELRRLLDSPFEYHVDWHAARAFNGAVLSDRQNVLQVLFFAVGYSFNESDSLVVGLQDMIVVGYLRDDSAIHLTASRFTECIMEAERAFSELKMIEGETIATQISRLHLRARYRANQCNAEAGCARFMTRIGGTIGGATVLEPEHHDDWLSADVEPEIAASFAYERERECEVILNEPRPEHVIVQQLRTSLPELELPILGGGKELLQTEHLILMEYDLRSVFLFARQF